MSREYDTDTHNTFMTLGTRLALGVAVGMIVVITIGYAMCFGVIRGSIMWTIVAVCGIILAYAIFGDRNRPHVAPRLRGATNAPRPVHVPTPIQAFPSGTVNGSDIVMKYDGQPFNFVDFDPTEPDSVLTAPRR